MDHAHPRPVSDLDQLLTQQAGVLTRAQALSCGCTGSRIEAHLRAGRWQRVYRRVYCTTTGPLSRLQQLWAALLYAGPGAVFSFETAAELFGLVAPQGTIHVTIPANRRIAATLGIRLHRSTRLDDTQVHPLLMPPRTRIERTVLDLADAARNVDRAFAWLADACQQRRTTPSRLRAALVASPETRRRALLLGALDDIAAGSHSLLERHFLVLCRRHRLPMPARQARVVDGRRTSWVDCDFGELRVRVELDGRIGHDPTLDRLRDMRRDNRSVVHGYLPLRFGWADVLGQSCAVASQLAGTLALRGWERQPATCGGKCTLERA